MKAKYAVIWQDHINFGIVEFSSSKEKAKLVKQNVSLITPETPKVVTIDKLIDLLEIDILDDDDSWYYIYDFLNDVGNKNYIVDYWFTKITKSFMVRKKGMIYIPEYKQKE